ncbi:MAG: hypothetical protein Tsb005_20780 [Gammaproteobacteria bacterium]
MNISLTQELEQYVQSKVASGLYTSASEVIRESLRLMHRYENSEVAPISTMNDAINTGLTQLQKGQKVRADMAYTKLKQKITSKHK